MAEAYSQSASKHEAEILFRVARSAKSATPDNTVSYWADVLQAAYTFTRGDISPEGLLGEVSLLSGGPHEALHPGMRPFASRVSEMDSSMWSKAVINTLNLAKAVRSQRAIPPHRPKALVGEVETQGDRIADLMMAPYHSQSYGRGVLAHVLKYALVTRYAQQS